MKTKKRYLLVFVFVFLFYAFLNVLNTKAIYRDSYRTTIDLTISSPTCIVKFETDGGVAVDDMEVECGTAIGTLPTTTKTDYDLNGWYLDDELTEEATEETIIDEEETYLYASWIPHGKVARIGTNYFDSLQAAINSITTSDKTTVQLLKDRTEIITIQANKNVELDLQNYTLKSTSKATISNNGILTINRGTVINTGTEGCINNNSNATLYINGGTFSHMNTKQALYNDGGVATITGNPYFSNVANDRPAINNLNGGILKLYGGTLVSEKFHALDNNSSTLYIGINDINIDTSNPTLKGNNYGVNSNVPFYYYDGIIEGKTSQFNDIDNVTLKPNTRIVEGVDGDYQTATLEFINTNYYTVTFDANGGECGESSREVFNGEAVGDLPTASKTGESFVGWFTSATGGEKISSSTPVTDNVTYYAHYTNAVCVRGTTLHTYGTITYGTVQTGNSIIAGDAFDCDVNGDGTFDADTERFYYLGTDSSGNALLIFYNNTSVSNNYAPSCNAPQIPYASVEKNNLGPDNAYVDLPPTSLWTNVSLMNNGVRQILTDTGTTSTGAGTIAPFTYTDKAARLPTAREIADACGVNLNTGSNTNLNFHDPSRTPTNCMFLFENVGPACPGVSGKNTYWTETVKNSTNNQVYRMMSQNNNEYVISIVNVRKNNSGIRPLIEVPLSLIELEEDSASNANTSNTSGSVPQFAPNTFSANPVVVPEVEEKTEEEEIMSPPTLEGTQTTNEEVEEEEKETTEEEIISTNPPTGDNIDHENMSSEAPKIFDTGYKGEIKVFIYNTETEGIGEEATLVTITEGTISNMDPNEVYYWESVEDPTINGIIKQDE